MNLPSSRITGFIKLLVKGGGGGGGGKNIRYIHRIFPAIHLSLKYIYIHIHIHAKRLISVCILTECSVGTANETYSNATHYTKTSIRIYSNQWRI